MEKFFLRIFFFFLFFFSFRSGQQASSGSGELFGFCPSFGQRAYALGGGEAKERPLSLKTTTATRRKKKRRRRGKEDYVGINVVPQVAI